MGFRPSTQIHRNSVATSGAAPTADATAAAALAAAAQQQRKIGWETGWTAAERTAKGNEQECQLQSPPCVAGEK